MLFGVPLVLSAQSVDSLQAIQKTDTVITKSQEMLNDIAAVTSLPQSVPQQVVDSLSFLQKAYKTGSAVIDSVNSILQTPGRKANEGIDKVESKTTDKYNKVATEANEGLEGVGINHSLKEAELGSVGASPQVEGVLPSTDALLEGVVPEGVDTEAIGRIQGAFSQSEQVLEQSKKVGNELQSIGRGDLSNTENLDGMAEQQLMKTDAMQAIEKEVAVFDELSIAEPSEIDARAMVEEQLKKQIVLQATAQFGKQLEPFQASIKQAGEYKKKYKEVQSLKNQQWVKRTSLADKSFRERLVPGVNFQVLDGDFLVIDFMPQISYLFNTKWQAGVVGVYRTNISKKHKPDQVKYNVLGFGAFTSYKVWKSFWLYAETDRNKVEAHLPPLSAGAGASVLSTDYDVLFGIKKSHQFTRHVKGHAQLLYNFLYNENTSPYPKPWHLRFGFEWYLKPAKKKKDQAEVVLSTRN